MGASVEHLELLLVFVGNALRKACKPLIPGLAVPPSDNELRSLNVIVDSIEEVVIAHVVAPEIYARLHRVLPVHPGNVINKLIFGLCCGLAEAAHAAVDAGESDSPSKRHAAIRKFRLPCRNILGELRHIVAQGRR